MKTFVFIYLLLYFYNVGHGQEVYNININDTVIIHNKMSSYHGCDRHSYLVYADTILCCFIDNKSNLEYLAYKIDSKNGNAPIGVFCIIKKDNVYLIDSLLVKPYEDLFKVEVAAFDFDNDGVKEIIISWSDESIHIIDVYKWTDIYGNISIKRVYRLDNLGNADLWEGRYFEAIGDDFYLYYQIEDASHVKSKIRLKNGNFIQEIVEKKR